ncbi:unnamed protein product [Paramecium octaurelia]|uniref:Uncharacterized protein n=1 Tax=Paramecium octaurelia TaxID=43137 RepID=A0A8S1WD46_PAROT|nr:unnamed protein product [Paramecium octaurelia]
MIELELQCANKHQKPILSVIFDNKYINNQKLLCHECMETFTEDTRIIGFKVVNQMIAESQKQKRDFFEVLIDNNQGILKSIQLRLVELKSSIIQELDLLDQITNSWIQSLNNIKSDRAAFSFFEELDKIIGYGKEKVSEMNKQTIFNEIKETNSLWNVKFINKLNKFNMFEDCLKCQAILQDLTLQEQGKLHTNQAQFSDIVDTQYKAIKCIFNQYILQPQNQQEYVNYFRNNVIKQNSFEVSNNEFQNIFSLFKKEFLENDQFIFINNNKERFEIFHQEFSQKLKKSKDQLLDMRQFYSQVILYDVVAKADIQNYLDNQFINDIIYLKERKSESFKSILDCFQIEYDMQLANNAFSNFFTNSREFKNSFKFKNNNNLEIDLSNTQISQNFKCTYKGLKVIQISDQSWNNNLKFKKELQQQYIIINTQIEIYPSQNQYQQLLNYIKSPQGDIPKNIRSNFLKQFNTIMIEQNCWEKLYKELYDLIKQEIGSSKSTINHKGYQNNKVDENISSCNPSIIKRIIQQVQNNIQVKYNNQFAQFGVILTDIGEKCIFYYSMLITWRFFCRNEGINNEIIKILCQLLN